MTNQLHGPACLPSTSATDGPAGRAGVGSGQLDRRATHDWPPVDSYVPDCREVKYVVAMDTVTHDGRPGRQFFVVSAPSPSIALQEACREASADEAQRHRRHAQIDPAHARVHRHLPGLLGQYL
jgi:hypothetical protein